jgi:DNA-binding winged helix-turn-helix (wHTH) protein
VLLKHSGEIVSKEVLIDSIWKGQVVSEGNLARQIKNLREKLGPDGIADFGPPRGRSELESIEVKS